MKDADQRVITTPEGIELPVVLASMGSRLVAFILDALIIMSVALGLALLTIFGGASGSFAAFFVLIVFLLRTFYFALFELFWQGSTPGKRNQRIRVIDAHGGPLSPGAIFARNLTREMEIFLPLVAMFSPEQLWPGASGVVALLAALWCVGLLLMPFFNRDRLRVGDLIAGTRVIVVPQEMLMEDLSARLATRPARYAFTATQLSHYGNYELQVLEDLLRREADVDKDTWRLVCEKIRKRIHWPDDQADVEPLVFLRDFYAAQRARLERGLLLGVRHADKNEAREAQARTRAG